jgi:rubrerythrin
MEGLRQTMRSRREILAGTGAVLGAGVVGSAAVAQEDDGAAGNQPTEIPSQFDQPDTDVDVLNYALTLEYLEDTFYDTGLEQFSDQELADAAALPVEADLVGQFFEQVSAQEQFHTEQLARVIEVLGGTPAEAPEFEFGFETAAEFVATAQVLENTGVSAYAGAAPRIESPDVLSAALSIHSVEARHAAVLNAFNGESPFPQAYDPALSIPDVLAAIDPFVVDGMDGGEDDGEEPPEEPEPTETEAAEPTDTVTENGTATEAENGTQTETGGTETGS